jgi:hypothetical protein
MRGGFPNPFKSAYRYLTRKNRKRSNSTRKFLRSPSIKFEESKNQGFPGKLPPKPRYPAPPSREMQQGVAKFRSPKTRKSRSKTTTITPIKSKSNIKKKNGMIKSVREFTKKVISGKNDIDFVLDDTRYDRDGFMYMRAPCQDGHALYNIIKEMKVTSLPVTAKVNDRHNLTYDLEIKDKKVLDQVNHALEKYLKRKIEDKGMARNKEEYMQKCYGLE